MPRCVTVEMLQPVITIYLVSSDWRSRLMVHLDEQGASDSQQRENLMAVACGNLKLMLSTMSAGIIATLFLLRI
eukprot:m.348641 g.348641  ORF g.348641 m.348641 type:complete len:74 (+) comp16563_c2_seq1:3119-3340(+)